MPILALLHPTASHLVFPQRIITAVLIAHLIEHIIPQLQQLLRTPRIYTAECHLISSKADGKMNPEFAIEIGSCEPEKSRERVKGNNPISPALFSIISAIKLWLVGFVLKVILSTSLCCLPKERNTNCKLKADPMPREAYANRRENPIGI